MVTVYGELVPNLRSLAEAYARYMMEFLIPAVKGEVVWTVLFFGLEKGLRAHQFLKACSNVLFAEKV